MDTTVLRSQSRYDRFNQIASSVESMFVPARHDRARQPPRAALLAVVEEHVGELAFGQLVQQVGRGRSARRRVEAHVERLVEAEAEAAPRGIELRAGQPQIKHN